MLDTKNPRDVFEAIDLLVKARSNLTDCLYLLKSIMDNSDIDITGETSGLTTWKEKIKNQIDKVIE